MIPIDVSVSPDRALTVFADELAIVRTDAELQALRTRWVGRKGSWVAAYMEAIGKATPEAKRRLGRLANELKKSVEAAIAEREAALATTRRPAGAVDVTLPGRRPLLGYRHPLSLVREQVQQIFSRLGYQVLEGSEVEDDYHNFEALNMPADHPARDMQDTLYLAEPLSPPRDEPPTRGLAPNTPQPLNLLRTHTSAMQIRHMERHDPPVRLVAIGPVYRRDNLDLTHTPMFHQVEGLVVGSHITLADLKGTLTSMAAELFGDPSTSSGSSRPFDVVQGRPELVEGRAASGDEATVRFRPSFFPYTEPSAEVDIRCIRCKGAGCAICKRTGWLEILGSGMVHPAVFEHVGYDPARVTGFAFGMGIERVAMLKWDVDDIRLFYENDLRFLEQFGL
jgi:phenylalanyl-tRNA synthetase alpha chain